ncbi:hypothetical protein [Salisediminibacterium beveridgei]|uniref:Uncharacterized protein n=1 Tax=Salisediminibacterium beveridgei TaxID=632773 RepID=A0A1D7QRJ2_9BACI|nr:hypothetical protein [Salisediminibacterium beveridgei]AOM81625.1 hypothetical protein BBEV_0230 [Salisediminibacterium beveridgei]
MMRKIGGKLFAPVFFVAVMAMMLFLPPDPSLTTSQVNSIEGVFLSSDEWIENNNISQEIKDMTEGLPAAQRSLMMRRLNNEEPVHVVYLSGQDFAGETGIDDRIGERYEWDEASEGREEELDDLEDHEDPYAVGQSTVTPDEEEVPREDWREGLDYDWTDFPYWVQVLNDDVTTFYNTQQVMDFTTIHPDEVRSVIEYTERVETIRRDYLDEVRQDEIDDAQDAGELPPPEIDHGEMPVYSEITRDVRRMNPDVVIIDLHLLLDHIEEGLRIEEGTNDINEIVRRQLYQFMDVLYRGNVDHFTTYFLYPSDINDRLNLGAEADLQEVIAEQISQLTIYNHYDERQMAHMVRIPAYSETHAYRWTREYISPLLTGE